MMVDKKNLFENIPADLKEELIEKIAQGVNLRVERIISGGHSSPKNFWYDQDENEFVVLLQGSAQLSFDDGTITKLTPGDYLNIPAHKKHRVDRTDTKIKTIWLVIFY